MIKKSGLFIAFFVCTTIAMTSTAYGDTAPVDPMGVMEIYNGVFGIVIKKIYQTIEAGRKTLAEIDKEADQPAPPPAEQPKPVEKFKVNRTFIDQWLKEGVPYAALKKAVAYIEEDKEGVITNHDYLTIIDFTAPSTEQRMFLLNLENGEMQKSLVAHGARSGGLKATNFTKSNKIESNKTTPGLHKFAEIYSGRHGMSYRLDGLEDRNSKARAKDVVVHAAKYATTNWVKKYGWLGRSQGCPAVSPDTMRKLLNKKLSGTLLYNYTILDKAQDDSQKK